MILEKKAVVLLSGGLDSATTLYYARSKEYQTSCLIFDYSQRHRKEVSAAVRIARTVRAPYCVIRVKMPWKGSALLDSSKPLPRRSIARIRRGIPSTYVPARNTIFLSFALSYAESIGARTIFIGANALDYSGYPDCRPEYYTVFNQLSRLATKAGIERKPIRIETPLIRKTKKQIVSLGRRLGVPFALTWSCYKGGSKPCGICDSCRLRAKGFQAAGIEDPLQ